MNKTIVLSACKNDDGQFYSRFFFKGYSLEETKTEMQAYITNAIQLGYLVVALNDIGTKFQLSKEGSDDVLLDSEVN